MTKRMVLAVFIVIAVLVLAGSGCSTMKAYQEETDTSRMFFDAASLMITQADEGGMDADDFIWALQHLNGADPLTVNDAGKSGQYPFLVADTARGAVEDLVFPDLTVQTNGAANGWVYFRYQDKIFVMEFVRRNGAKGNESYKPFVTSITSCTERGKRPAAETGTNGGLR